MELFCKIQESNLFLQDLSYDFENTESINFFVDFQDSFSEEYYEEDQIYYSYSTNEKSKDFQYSSEENIEKIEGNQINFIYNIYKKIKKKKEEKKKKDFKSNLKFVNLKQKNKKISDYLTATERKQRKMLKNLKKRKEKMKIKSKVHKRKNNSEILKFNNLFKTPILLNEKDFQKFPCSFIGRKRMKF
jgi:hypothetical protein